MTGLMQRILRRRPSGSPRGGATGPLRRLRSGLFRRRAGAKRLPWGKQAAAPEVRQQTQGTGVVVQQETAPAQPGFRDRGRLRRRLRFLRRARELAFRDIGGLMFDMRRFGSERPDLVESKIGALAAVDQELRALERILDDRRPLHELREPGITSCARCGALHSSEANFCPHCGLQVGGPRAMGEIGGAIAAPPKAPQAPLPHATSAPVATASPPTEAMRPPHAPDDGS
jgi:ribosomal protein L40E